MLKPYMVFSNFSGSAEGALLVFAHSVREARKVGWRCFSGELTDQYIDFGANLIRNSDFLLAEADIPKLIADEPHGVWNIKSCKWCERWGQSAIGDDELCEDCRAATVKETEAGEAR